MNLMHTIKNLHKVNEDVEQNSDLDELFEEELREDYFTVQYYNSNGSVVDDKFKNFKSKAEADKYAKRGNSVDRVGGKYKTFKVKGRMESVEVKGDMESIELDEALNIKSVMSELKKKLSLLSGDVKSGNTNDIITRLESISISIDKSVKELKRNMKESVELEENCGIDHNTLKGDDKKKHMKDIHPSIPHEKTETIDENMKGIAKAMGNLASKPEFKKISRNLKSLVMRAGEGDKGAAKQIRTQLAKLASKVDKKSGAKLTKMSKLVATYESVELGEAKVTLDKDGGYEVYASGKRASGVMYFLSYKNKIISSGSKKDGEFVFGFKHKDINQNSRYQPAGMVKKGKDFTHMGFKKAKEIIAFAKNLGITEDIKLDELHR
jgi:hypothetical protein